MFGNGSSTNQHSAQHASASSWVMSNTPTASPPFSASQQQTPQFFHPSINTGTAPHVNVLDAHPQSQSWQQQNQQQQQQNQQPQPHMAIAM
eukprot:scaffold421276_cov70-Attheya_sp.AAC.1